jgi:hypothetical protein
MVKERFELIASGLGNYFGVGFITPQEQLDIDMGRTEPFFDDEAQDRMDLGNIMEDACLNYFENKMGIVIDERNSEYGYAFDGKLKCKRDGRTYIDGIETGWESKYSNASISFVNNTGYSLQCQGYMAAWNLEQWVLAGMWQGKPVYKLIKHNQELQDDIEEMVNRVFDILIGLADEDTFPWHLVEKYSPVKQCKVLSEDSLTEYDKNLLKNIATLRQEKKSIETKLDELEAYAKLTFTDSMYEDKDFKYTISTSKGRSSFDKDRLAMEHPEIDLDTYNKMGEPSKTLRCTPKKKTSGK